jgi:hypothetical protein
MPVTISGSSGITNVDGTAGAPAEKGTTSSTAGVYFPAANTVAISTNSTEALRVDASQNVGIGNTPSGTYKLQVTGSVYASTTLNDSIGEVRTVPVNSQTAAYNVASTDAGKFISITTGGVSVLTTTAFTTGQSVSIYNNSGSSQTITQGASVTIYLVGTATTGNRTLAQRGLCTLLCVGSNTYVITGGGVT